jgi:hypothetical protein
MPFGGAVSATGLMVSSGTGAAVFLATGAGVLFEGEAVGAKSEVSVGLAVSAATGLLVSSATGAAVSLATGAGVLFEGEAVGAKLDVSVGLAVSAATGLLVSSATGAAVSLATGVRITGRTGAGVLATGAGEGELSVGVPAEGETVEEAPTAGDGASVVVTGASPAVTLNWE